MSMPRLSIRSVALYARLLAVEVGRAILVQDIRGVLEREFRAAREHRQLKPHPATAG